MTTKLFSVCIVIVQLIYTMALINPFMPNVGFTRQNNNAILLSMLWRILFLNTLTGIMIIIMIILILTDMICFGHLYHSISFIH